MENPGFLKKKYNHLHTTPEAQSAANRTEKRSEEKVLQSPEDQIQNYLDRFSEILNREDEGERQQGIEALKKVLHKELVINPENIPYRAFELEQDIAEQGGHGRPEITETFKQQKIEEIIHDQEASLDTWITYLASPDAMYPDWAKYWAFRSMTQMGGYNKEQGKFGKRKKDTVHAFPTLNAGCLADTIGHLQDHLEISELHKDDPLRKEKEQALMEELSHDEETRKLLTTENFAKIYTHYLEEFGRLTWENLEVIKGIWKQYDQGSEPDELVASLKGFPLEWCTRNETTARNQLQAGDFHVYYSQNNDGVAKLPRLAIRMNGISSIGEVRGIEKDQNIDQYIQPVLDEKLTDFGQEGQRYLKKSEDMKQMTTITTKHRQGQELTTHDLRFLYELDGKIEGFGYKDDPRIEEVKEGRDERTDLASLFNCKPEQIAQNQEEALSGDCIYYGGDLDLRDLTSAEELTLPEHLAGKLDLRSLTTLGKLKLPYHVGSDVYLSELSSADKLVLPKHIEGDLFLNNLISAQKIKLPDFNKGNLYLTNFHSFKELVLPKYSGGYINLRSLTSAKGVVISNYLTGTLDLRGLKSAEGLKLPEDFRGNINLNGLSKAEGLNLPDSFKGDVFLRGLETTEELTLPEHMKGHIYLENINLE